MKITALITTLVLGSSSLALAQPGSQLDTRAGAQPDIRDHRDPDAYGRDHRGPAMPAWITLASTRLRDGRTALPIDPRSGRFSTLKIESTGLVTITNVMIEFANGQTQFVKLGQRSEVNRPITIDLDGNKRAIKRVVVTSRSWRRGANVSVLAV